MRRFYLSPRTVAQLGGYALRNNPAWFGVSLRKLPYFMKATGVDRLLESLRR